MLYSSTVERSFLREAPPKCMNAVRFCTVLRGSIISQPFEPSHVSISNGSRCVFPAMHLRSASPVRNLPLQTSLPSSSRSRKKKLFIQKYFKLGIECKLKLKAILMFISMSLEVSFYYLLYILARTCAVVQIRNPFPLLNSRYMHRISEARTWVLSNNVSSL